jgi:hypothetical protein
MNQINDLNKVLFDRLNALSNNELNEDELNREISKTDAIVKVSDMILKNAQTALKAQELFDTYATGRTVDIPLLGISNDNLMCENKRLRRELKEVKGL